MTGIPVKEFVQAIYHSMLRTTAFGLEKCDDQPLRC